ncbi:MAG TPA: hypothetical protein VMV90_04000 [Rectinemataceae bacterium]|nr:hypothetical protein [Rectinemataceae bacterium]
MAIHAAKARFPAAAALTVLALFLQAAGARAQSVPHSILILPSPEPFSLSARDAQQAIDMIRSVGLLEFWDGKGQARIVAVRRLWAVFTGYDPRIFAGHRRRYDLVLNGRAMDWDHLYIEYGGGMVNLRALFTYRNQYPPDDLNYRMPPDF